MAMKQTIIEMIEHIPGGKSAVAGFLGFTESELNNRLYQTKGQRFKNEELIAIQLEYGCTQFIEELCRAAGGRFVPDTCVDDLDAVESALADGEITSNEEDLIRKLLNKHLAATQHSIECVISLNKRQ